MNKKHLQILLDNYTALTENMDADVILPHLMQNRIININDQETIKSIQTTMEKNNKVLEIIQRRGCRAFKALVHALMSTQQLHLADKLNVLTEDEMNSSVEYATPTDTCTPDVMVESLPDGRERFSVSLGRPMSDCNSAKRKLQQELSNQGETDDESDEADLKRKVLAENNHLLSYDVPVPIFEVTIVPAIESCALTGIRHDITTCLLVSGLEKTQKIKEYIELNFGILPEDQILLYQNQVMCDKSVILSCNPSSLQITVQLIPKFIYPQPHQFEIQIGLFDYEGPPIKINVTKQDDVKTLKAKLKLKHPKDVPYYQLYVVYQGRELQQGTKLHEYGIETECCLSCQVRSDYFSLCIRDVATDTRFTVPVTGAISLSALNLAISAVRKISPNMYHLFYKGRQLQDDKALLEIDNLSKLSKTEMKLKLVMSGMILLQVKHNSGELYESYDHYVRWNDSILSLKEEISEYTNIPIESQILTFAGKFLEDDKVFDWYGINKNSNACIYVHSNSDLINLKINVKIGLQKTRTLESEHDLGYVGYAPSTSIKEVKFDISYKILEHYPIMKTADIKFYLAAVRHDTAILDDNSRTIETCGFKNGDHLTVIFEIESTSQMLDTLHDVLPPVTSLPKADSQSSNLHRFDSLEDSLSTTPFPDSSIMSHFSDGQSKDEQNLKHEQIEPLHTEHTTISSDVQTSQNLDSFESTSSINSLDFETSNKLNAFNSLQEQNLDENPMNIHHKSHVKDGNILTRCISNNDTPDVPKINPCEKKEQNTDKDEHTLDSKFQSMTSYSSCVSSYNDSTTFLTSNSSYDCKRTTMLSSADTLKPASSDIIVSTEVITLSSLKFCDVDQSFVSLDVLGDALLESENSDLEN